MKLLCRAAIATCLALAPSFTASQGTRINELAISRLSNLHYRNFSYWEEGSKWSSPRIPVCWENPENADAVSREWVRSAITRTWEAESALRFYGWGKCVEKSRGIRIKIADDWPVVYALGVKLDGLKDGMVLNFSFNFDASWKAACGDKPRHCVELTAIHEFGHAIGLVHEHARPDMPAHVRGWCEKEVDGTSAKFPVGEWDPQSVMNYCNSDWINAGKMSLLDIQGVRLIYGAPLNPK